MNGTVLIVQALFPDIYHLAYVTEDRFVLTEEKLEVSF